VINTILVEDDLYIQKHFVDRLAADGEFHLVGVFRDAFEAEKHCDATVVSTMDEVKRTAQQLGVAVKIDGYLPRDTAAEELTVAAAKECVTNCIKHADGNEVYIRIAQRGERYDVTITNNGKIPTEPIKEGSGLSTLRRSIESSGGEMHISHNPRFALLITIPAKEMSL